MVGQHDGVAPPAKSPDPPLFLPDLFWGVVHLFNARQGVSHFKRDCETASSVVIAGFPCHERPGKDRVRARNASGRRPISRPRRMRRTPRDYFPRCFRWIRAAHLPAAAPTEALYDPRTSVGGRLSSMRMHGQGGCDGPGCSSFCRTLCSRPRFLRTSRKVRAAAKANLGCGPQARRMRRNRARPMRAEWPRRQPLPRGPAAVRGDYF